METTTGLNYSTPELDYKTMWDKLGADMEHLMRMNVTIFHPAIVLGYMGFIQQIEEAKKRDENNGNG